MLRKVVRESVRDWDQKLPYIMSAYRAAKHESTGYSPYVLVYGRTCRIPIDIALGQVTEERQYSQTYDDYIVHTAEKTRDTHQVAREQLASTADRAEVVHTRRLVLLLLTPPLPESIAEVDQAVHRSVPGDWSHQTE